MRHRCCGAGAVLLRQIKLSCQKSHHASSGYEETAGLVLEKAIAKGESDLPLQSYRAVLVTVTLRF